MLDVDPDLIMINIGAVESVVADTEVEGVSIRYFH